MLLQDFHSSSLFRFHSHFLIRCLGIWGIGIALTLGTLPLASAETNCSAVTEISQRECESLLQLYQSTDGANWKKNEDWHVTNTPCSWYGITCENNGVIKIRLVENNLNGTIPDFSALPNLQELILYKNQLIGSIPDFSALPNLQLPVLP